MLVLIRLIFYYYLLFLYLSWVYHSEKLSMQRVRKKSGNLCTKFCRNRNIQHESVVDKLFELQTEIIFTNQPLKVYQINKPK